MNDLFDAVFLLTRDKSLLSNDIFDKSILPTLSYIHTDFELKKESKLSFEKWILYQLDKISQNAALKLDKKFIAESILREDSFDTFDYVAGSIEWLNSIPNHEQRSPEWYKYREQVITASSMSKVFGSNAEYRSILKEKVVLETRSSLTGKACLYGIKFEPIAQRIYEDMKSCKISEYGCIRHKHINHIGASPDGIVTVAERKDLLGRMLEIKCLYSRELTGIPLHKYWIQCQIQLEVCNLEMCDFFECKINESYNAASFKEKIESDVSPKYFGIMIKLVTKNTLIESYENSPIGITGSCIINWYDDIVKMSLTENVMDIVHVTYWILEEQSCVTIHRNRSWFETVRPKIEAFWNDVEHHRELFKTDENLFVKDQNQKKNAASKPSQSPICLINDDD
jgi:putative phage-type endonuclease